MVSLILFPSIPRSSYYQAQQTLSTYDRELLAAFLAVLKFKTLIDGHSVTLFTDHKSFVSALYSKSTPQSDRQQRQLSLISEYVAEVQYVAGRDNVVANCLSRTIASISTDTFDLSGIAHAQNSDPELDTYRDQLTSFTLPNSSTLLCDTTFPTPRPFIPAPLHSNIIVLV